MGPIEFDRYTERLRSALESTSGVKGLVVLGTTADASLRDEWSDHDFWVITELSTMNGNKLGDLTRVWPLPQLIDLPKRCLVALTDQSEHFARTFEPAIAASLSVAVLNGMRQYSRAPDGGYGNYQREGIQHTPRR